MPVLRQKFVEREDLRANPDALYLFSDSVRRTGMGGQAGNMRGEANAVGIATNWKPTNGGVPFFNDADFNDILKILNRDLLPARDHLRAGGIVVVPIDGLGTGLSDLPKRAPRVHVWLQNELKSLALIGIE